MYTATRTRKNRRADTQTTVAPDVTIRRASCRAKHTRDSIPRALNYPRRNSLRRPRWLWGIAEQQIIFSVSSGGRDHGLSGPAKTHGVCDPPPPTHPPKQHYHHRHGRTRTKRVLSPVVFLTDSAHEYHNFIQSVNYPPPMHPISTIKQTQ